jgi:catechol 2,3-dioxygenase-like lactoylglutathione lyase family enzyme
LAPSAEDGVPEGRDETRRGRSDRGVDTFPAVGRLMLRVKRLDHFGVDVGDLERAERFYTEVLGMSVAMRLADQILLRHGDGNLALFFKPGRVPGGRELIENPLGKSHHAFEVSWEDLHAARRLFAEREIPHHPFIAWGDHECLYFLDPDGNLLELVGYRPPAVP